MSCKISVVMTTYNGEKYIIQQLDSIRSQSLMPDEVIISDDGSSDKTVEIVNHYIAKNVLINWHVFVNKPNIGWKANFYKAIGYSTGDIVFFSDQDDIWNTDKIEIMSSLMEKHQMGALYATKTIIDSEGHLMEERQEKKCFSGKIKKIELTPSFYEVKTLGCCMCISRRVANLYQRLSFFEDDHDSQCGRIAVFCDTLWYLDKPVIQYRIHNNNTSGISGVASFGQSTKSIRIKEIQTIINWIDRANSELNLNSAKNNLLKNCKSFLVKRLGFFSGSTTFFYLLFHLKYYTGMTMLMGDVAYKYNFNKTAGRFLWKLKKKK